MDIKSTRLANLGTLLARYGNHKGRLAAAIGKKPAQVSQWFAGVRTISEDSARDIESALKLAADWMDREAGRTPGNHMAPIPIAASVVVAEQELPSHSRLFERVDEVKLRALARADLLRLEGALIGAAGLLGLDIVGPASGLFEQTQSERTMTGLLYTLPRRRTPLVAPDQTRRPVPPERVVQLHGRGGFLAPLDRIT